LTSRNRQHPLPILRGFGLLSPTVMKALLASNTKLLKLFMTLQGGPLHAANLCNFFRSKRESGFRVTDDVYSAVLDRLMENEGYVLNGLRNAESASTSAV